MPVLKNQRWERFAQGLAEGLTADQAYADAGFKPNRGNATRLKAYESIQARVAEIQSKAAKKVEITVESIVTELEEARALAMKEGQSSAAVAASTAKAKLLGLWVERRDIDLTHHIADLSDDELVREVEALMDGTAPDGLRAPH